MIYSAFLLSALKFPRLDSAPNGKDVIVPSSAAAAESLSLFMEEGFPPASVIYDRALFLRSSHCTSCRRGASARCGRSVLLSVRRRPLPTSHLFPLS